MRNFKFDNVALTQDAFKNTRISIYFSLIEKYGGAHLLMSSDADLEIKMSIQADRMFAIVHMN